MPDEKDLGELILTHNNKRIYRKDGVITKVFDHDHYAFSTVCQEAMYTAFAKELGLNVPEVYNVCPVGMDYALEMEEIKGPTLARLMDDNPQDTRKYIKILVKVQQDAVLGRYCDDLILQRMKDKFHKRISSSGLEASTRYDLHVRLDSFPNHNKLCHGDMAPHNIILSDNKYYILDWAHATVGNASGDAAVTYILFKLAGKDKEAEIYLNEFCKRSDIARQVVEQWISIASVSKLVKTEDPEKRAMLMKNINVVEY